MNLHAGLGDPTSSTPRSDPTALHLAVRRHALVSTSSSVDLCLLLILRLQQVAVVGSVGFGPHERSVYLEKLEVILIVIVASILYGSGYPSVISLYMYIYALGFTNAMH